MEYYFGGMIKYTMVPTKEWIRIVRILDKLEPTDAPKPKYISFAEARAELDISPDTLTRGIKRNGIPTYRNGRGKKFERCHLPYLH